MSQTMKVRTAGFPDGIIINREDFNASVHKRIAEDDDAPAQNFQTAAEQELELANTKIAELEAELELLKESKGDADALKNAQAAVKKAEAATEEALALNKALTKQVSSLEKAAVKAKKVED